MPSPTLDAKRKAALDEVQPQALSGRTKFWNGVIYGEYGVGKTKVAGDCVKKFGIDIATDHGSDTYYNHPELLDKIKVVPYSGLSQLTSIALAKEEGYGEYADVDLIICDTVSQMQEEYLDWLNDNYTFSGNMREKATPRQTAPKGLKNEEIIGLGDYNLTRRNMSTPIKTLIKAPVNVMFIAHLREPSFIEQGKGKLLRRPSLTETVYKLIAREATFLGFMDRKGKDRTIQFKTDPRTSAKSQIKELDDQIINADDLAKILHEWELK